VLIEVCWLQAFGQQWKLNATHQSCATQLEVGLTVRVVTLQGMISALSYQLFHSFEYENAL
jgi:hypothetical protein